MSSSFCCGYGVLHHLLFASIVPACDTGEDALAPVMQVSLACDTCSALEQLCGN
jgi:hypothetical protein